MGLKTSHSVMMAVRSGAAGWHGQERNSPEERGTHRDFARKESGN